MMTMHLKYIFDIQGKIEYPKLDLKGILYRGGKSANVPRSLLKKVDVIPQVKILKIHCQDQTSHIRNEQYMNSKRN